ncbi:TPA: hypothetical protein HA265_05600, partial [Candidatus Woesearchaeota archaeon]|nr:hypothetical protein [Candidatus Woesearchaeota archaeon]
MSSNVVDYGPRPAYLCYDSDNDGAYNTSSDSVCPGYRDCDDTDGSLLPPREGLVLNSDTTLCSGTYYVNDTNQGGIIRFNATSIELSCLGTVMVGNNQGAGAYIVSDSNNITGCTFSNYSKGITYGFTGWNWTMDPSFLHDYLYGVAVDSKDEVIVAGYDIAAGDNQQHIVKLDNNGVMK